MAREHGDNNSMRRNQKIKFSKQKKPSITDMFNRTQANYRRGTGTYFKNAKVSTKRDEKQPFFNLKQKYEFMKTQGIGRNEYKDEEVDLY